MIVKPPRDSAATVQALRLIDSRGWTAYKAAKHVGINLSTIYRALKRRVAKCAIVQTYVGDTNGKLQIQLNSGYARMGPRVAI